MTSKRGACPSHLGVIAVAPDNGRLVAVYRQPTERLSRKYLMKQVHGIGSGGEDLNLRDLPGWRPDELPDCSTPHLRGLPDSTNGLANSKARAGSARRSARSHSCGSGASILDHVQHRGGNRG